MDVSPGGNTIERVTGSPEDIIDRGQAVIDLGQMMLDSATTLENIKNRAVDGGEMTGLAVNELRDRIGDSYEQLREAGELYRPVGPVVRTYGLDLQRLQPLIDTVVSECEALWTALINTPDPGRRPSDYDDDPCVAAAHDEQVRALESAQAEWDAKAAEFDRLYNGDCDSWEYVFDQAVAGIGNAMSGQIKDGWWDKWGSDLFALLSDILAIAGLIIFVAGLIVGGPIIAAIAAGIAVAALAVTAVRFAYGEASGWDLALAIVGVVPFASQVKGLNKVQMFGSMTNPAGRGIVLGTKAADLWGNASPAIRNLHTAAETLDFVISAYDNYTSARDGARDIRENYRNVMNNPDMPFIGENR
jgi:hypothetical protein